jgi:UDP-2,3-diacylglucosamine pyrophosphatase LpxH
MSNTLWRCKMFAKELKFFIKNQSKLVQQYRGKYLLIHGDNVIQAFDTALEAYLDGNEKFEPGKFMIQPCLPGSDAYTVSISSANTIFE